MARIITAKVYFRDTCDPDVPGDCAPVVELEGAAELEGLVAEHGISFEEPFQEQEPGDTFADELVQYEEVTESDPELEVHEIPTDLPECPLEPGVEWDVSVCGDLERKIVARVFGG